MTSDYFDTIVALGDRETRGLPGAGPIGEHGVPSGVGRDHSAGRGLTSLGLRRLREAWESDRGPGRTHPEWDRYSPEMKADSVIGRCTAPDGVELAYRQFGEGRPLVLVHGFSSDSRQWIEHGLAAALAAPGHRVIMPDLRGHGASGRPHEASAYPPDVLADDGLTVVSALGLPNKGYDLCGYSMGGRVALRMLVRGAEPARAVIAGQGLDVTQPASDRTAVHRRLLTAMIEGTPLEPQEKAMVDWMAQRGVDPQALLLVLDSFVATPPEALAQITVPTLVVIGERDPRASAAKLATAIPSAQFASVPGAHDALGRPEMIATILEFLDAPSGSTRSSPHSGS